MGSVQSLVKEVGVKISYVFGMEEEVVFIRRHGKGDSLHEGQKQCIRVAKSWCEKFRREKVDGCEAEKNRVQCEIRRFGQQVTGMYAELGREKASAEYQGAAETSLPIHQCHKLGLCLTPKLIWTNLTMQSQDNSNTVLPSDKAA
jgi:hypothetical protein